MVIPKTYLTEAYEIGNKEILRILTQNKQINKADPNYSYYEKLANWATSKHRQQQLKNINLGAIELSDRGLIEKSKLAGRVSTLGHALNALKSLMDQEGNYNPNDADSKLIQKTTMEILASLSGIKGDVKPVDAPQEKPEDKTDSDVEDKKETDDTGAAAGDQDESKDTITAKPTDWTAEKAKRLASPGTKTTSEILDKFYDDYYKLEYASINPAKEADIIAKLKSLDKILVQEFNKLGYNPEVNPFAQFLKNLIERRIDIFLKLDTNTYGAIHNSFIRQYITGNLLGIYSDKNILFCSDLYNHRGLDIVNYLHLYKQIIRSAKGNSEYSDDPELLAAKMILQQEPRGTTYEENIRKLLDDKNNINLPSSDGSKLRSELEVSELYNHVFKTKLKKQLSPRAIDEICFKVEKEHIMRAMVQYILDLDVLATREQTEYENWFSKLKYIPNEKNIKDSKKILSEYELDHSVNKLLKQLKTRIDAKNQKAKANK